MNDERADLASAVDLDGALRSGLPAEFTEAIDDLRGWSPSGDLDAIFERVSANVSPLDVDLGNDGHGRRRHNARMLRAMATVAAAVLAIVSVAVVVQRSGDDEPIHVAEPPVVTPTAVDSPIRCTTSSAVDDVDVSRVMAELDAAIKIERSAQGDAVAAATPKLSGALAVVGTISLATGEEPQIWHEATDAVLQRVPAPWACAIAVPGATSTATPTTFSPFDLDFNDGAVSCLAERKVDEMSGMTPDVRRALDDASDIESWWAIAQAPGKMIVGAIGPAGPDATAKAAQRLSAAGAC